MSPPPAVDVPPHPVPVGPSLERWREMSSDERARFIDSVNDALSQPALAMTEGRPHRLAKSRTLDVLGLHFGAIGRTIYLADELAVIYPGEPGFSPDILAVLDVPQIENDERMAWVVADEGKGIDLAIEVLHAGDRKKDLVDNVERYARLGIPEYFVYDRARQQIVGYRLGERARYERIVPQGGRVRSAVLALDLAIQGGSLRFFHGTAELFGTSDLVLRLSGMVEDLEARADEATAQLGAKSAELSAKSTELSAKSAELSAKSAELARSEAAAEATFGALRAGILEALASRGVVCPEDVRTRVLGCRDPARLAQWLGRAFVAAEAGQIFAD